jgi:hypothetical protein
MGRKERKIINTELLEGCKKGYRWRANSGMAWQGKKIRLPTGLLIKISDWMTQEKIKHKEIMILVDPRPFHGMPSGFFDVFGWEEMTVCEYLKHRDDHFPCMQNKTDNKKDCEECGLNIPVAVFVGVECKTPGDNLKPDQIKYRDALKKSGGIYHVRREYGYTEE